MPLDSNVPAKFARVGNMQNQFITTEAKHSSIETIKWRKTKLQKHLLTWANKSETLRVQTQHNRQKHLPKFDKHVIIWAPSRRKKHLIHKAKNSY